MDLDALVKEIREHISHLNVEKIGNMDGDTLSRLVVRLASYNSTLGEYVAKSERDADYAEAHYEWTREEIYKQARIREETVADADNKKRTESKPEKEAYLEAKYNYRVLAILRSDMSNLLDALRSRLSYLKHERETNA